MDRRRLSAEAQTVTEAGTGRQKHRRSREGAETQGCSKKLPALSSDCCFRTPGGSGSGRLVSGPRRLEACESRLPRSRRFTPRSSPRAPPQRVRRRLCRRGPARRAARLPHLRPPPVCRPRRRRRGGGWDEWSAGASAGGGAARGAAGARYRAAVGAGGGFPEQVRYLWGRRGGDMQRCLFCTHWHTHDCLLFFIHRFIRCQRRASAAAGWKLQEQVGCRLYLTTTGLFLDPLYDIGGWMDG
jgi:hypothetical protein